MNISPQCVVVTHKGMWKLIGLGFAQTWSEPGQQVSHCYMTVMTCRRETARRLLSVDSFVKLILSDVVAIVEAVRPSSCAC